MITDITLLSKRFQMAWYIFFFSELECPEPEKPKNGKLVSCSDRKYQGSCKIKCDPGYSLNGPSVRYCTTSGESVKWTGSTPTCQGSNWPFCIFRKVTSFFLEHFIFFFLQWYKFQFIIICMNVAKYRVWIQRGVVAKMTSKPGVVFYCYLSITRTLCNSNLTSTPNKFHFLGSTS